MVPRTLARVVRDCCSTPQAIGHWPEPPLTVSQPRGASEPSPSLLGELVDPAGLGTWPESPRTAGGPRGPLHPIAILPGELVDTVGLRILTRVARDR